MLTYRDQIKILIKTIQVMFVTLLFLAGFGHLATLILPPPVYGSFADIGLGVVLLVTATALLLRWNWLRFVRCHRWSA